LQRADPDQAAPRICGDPAAGDTAFYDSVYANFGSRLAATIRAQAFEDIGQNSWLTAGEHRKFCDWLQLDASSEVLEIASGSGGPALFMVHETGCSVIGVELPEAAVRAADDAAAQRGLVDRARFIGVDAREPLPFENASFDAVICIDSINHMYERLRVFAARWEHRCSLHRESTRDCFGRSASTRFERRTSRQTWWL
jgi:Methyltransferase domain